MVRGVARRSPYDLPISSNANFAKLLASDGVVVAFSMDVRNMLANGWHIIISSVINFINDRQNKVMSGVQST
jgi:hypothetical protein